MAHTQSTHREAARSTRPQGRTQAAWGSGCCAHKIRIICVVSNSSSDKLVRTKLLVKNCIVLTDSREYREWYKSHCALPLGCKKGAKQTPEEKENLKKKQSQMIIQKTAKISSFLEEQFQWSKLLACIAPRPDQCG